MTMHFLFATLSLVLGLQLFAHGRRQGEIAILVYAGSFASMTLAWILGGVVTGFTANLGGSGLEIVYRLATLMIGLASFCLVAGVVLACSAGFWRQALLVVLALKLMLFAFWMSTAIDERVAVWDVAVALVLVIVLEGWALLKSGAKSAPWILVGSTAALAALAGRVVAWSGSLVRAPEAVWPAVLYNVLALLALVVLYQGGRRLHDRLP